MNTKTTNPKKTVLILCVGLMILYFIARSDWLWMAALALGLTGLFSAGASARVDDLWMKLSGLLGRVVTGILLCVVFFFLLLPVALLSRRFGRRDPLNLNNKPGSNFHDCNRSFERISFEKPW